MGEVKEEENEENITLEEIQEAVQRIKMEKHTDMMVFFQRW